MSLTEESVKTTDGELESRSAASGLGLSASLGLGSLTTSGHIPKNQKKSSKSKENRMQKLLLFCFYIGQRADLLSQLWEAGSGERSKEYGTSFVFASLRVGSLSDIKADKQKNSTSVDFYFLILFLREDATKGFRKRRQEGRQVPEDRPCRRGQEAQKVQKGDLLRLHLPCPQAGPPGYRFVFIDFHARELIGS